LEAQRTPDGTLLDRSRSKVNHPNGDRFDNDHHSECFLIKQNNGKLLIPLCLNDMPTYPTHNMMLYDIVCISHQAWNCKESLHMHAHARVHASTHTHTQREQTIKIYIITSTLMVSRTMAST
jgi:hypothetical protein